jgi:tRNA U55 pseudouridine synthase TruB
LQKLIDENFVGKIKQTPPHRSAVKVQERERTVYHWTLREAAPKGVPPAQKASADADKVGKAGSTGRDFLFETRVEGGTYIRKLCSDLGEMIGGAHMGELRRTEAGIFDESTLVNLFDFKSAVDKYRNGDERDLKKMLVPAEDAIKKVLPVVEVDKSAIKALYIGKPLLKSNVISQRDDSGEPDAPELKDGDVFAAFCVGQFIGIYKRGKEKVTFARPEFVFN